MHAGLSVLSDGSSSLPFHMAGTGVSSRLVSFLSIYLSFFFFSFNRS